MTFVAFCKKTPLQLQVSTQKSEKHQLYCIQPGVYLGEGVHGVQTLIDLFFE